MNKKLTFNGVLILYKELIESAIRCIPTGFRYIWIFHQNNNLEYKTFGCVHNLASKLVSIQ